jgi:hypothetical protein
MNYYYKDELVRFITELVYTTKYHDEDEEWTKEECEAAEKKIEEGKKLLDSFEEEVINKWCE